MTTQKNTHTTDDHKKGSDHTKQNFASKSKEEVKELASKGGRSHGDSHKDEDTKSSSHSTKSHTNHTRKDDDKDTKSHTTHARKEDDKDTKSSSHSTKSHTTHTRKEDDKDDDHREHGKQGFASMPHDKVVEIARLGGQHSHDNDNKKKDDTENRSSAKK